MLCVGRTSAMDAPRAALQSLGVRTAQHHREPSVSIVFASLVSAMCEPHVDDSRLTHCMTVEEHACPGAASRRT